MTFHPLHLLFCIVLLLTPPVCDSSPGATERLQAYLRIRTDHGRASGPDYAGAEAFLNATIAAHLPCATVRSVSFAPGKPLLLATIKGSDASLPSLLLNSHTDVVPAESSHWTSPPFDARLRNGKIFARGAQDMKSVGMSYLEALSALCATGWRPLRTVHVSFVPDEEVGGVDGMGELVGSALWGTLRVGCVLDEGAPHAEGSFHVWRGERTSWVLVVEARGAPGHGATLPAEAAVGTLMGVVARVLEFRAGQRAKLEAGAELGDIVNVNVAFLEAGAPDGRNEAGYQMNMIPSVARAGFDIRVPPDMQPADVDAAVRRWLSCDGEPCPSVSHMYVRKTDVEVATDLETSSWYADAFFAGLKASGVERDELQIGIFPATSDLEFVRGVGVAGIGFSPIRNTENLLHKHDEYITVEGYLKGIEIYKALIRSMTGSAPAGEYRQEL